MDLEVIIVSHRDGRRLLPCVRSLRDRAGACSYRETIVGNDGPLPPSLTETPSRRLVRVEDRGFGAAGNEGARDADADLLLFLNPDTELVEGTLEQLVRTMHSRPRAGVLAVRQVTDDGRAWPLHEGPSPTGSRVPAPEGWRSPSAVLAVRREAFEAVGGFTERVLPLSDETDLWRRIQDTGWEALYEPRISFVHHAGGNGAPPSMRNGDGTQPQRGVTSVMGLPFDAIDQDTVVRRVLEAAKKGVGGWIVTANLDILRQFRRSGECRDLAMSATYRLADGMPIIWASRLAGAPLPERVPGSDLAVSLPRAAARAGLPMFLLGGNPGVAATAAERLRSLLGTRVRVGSYCPPNGFEDDPRQFERIRRELRRVHPALVMVGLGFPKQERLVRRLRAEFRDTWFIGVGISLSFLADDQPRAPEAMQRLGLEWLHRLAHEPRRLFKRYVVHDLPFAMRLFGWALAHRLHGEQTHPARASDDGFGTLLMQSAANGNGSRLGAGTRNGA